MKRGKLRINVILVFVALLMVGTVANAQRGRRGDGYGRGYGNQPMKQNWYDRLELTDEQQEKIEEIKLASSKASIQNRNKINELEAQLTTSLSEDKVDKTKVNKLIDDIGKIRTDERKARMEDHLKIRALLTDKQKLIFDQHRSGRNFNRGYPYHRNRG